MPDTHQTGLGSPRDPCALCFKSEDAQPAQLPNSYSGQFIAFLWKWDLFVLLPELEQPFLLPYPVTWALFLSSNLACATGYCWYFLCYVMTELNNAQVSPRCLTQLLQLAQETHCFKQE